MANRTRSPRCSVRGPRKPNSIAAIVAAGAGSVAGCAAVAIVKVVNGHCAGLFRTESNATYWPAFRFAWIRLVPLLAWASDPETRSYCRI